VEDKDPATAKKTESLILNNNNIPAIMSSGEDSVHSVQSSTRDTVDEHFGPRKTVAEGYYQEMAARTFPIWAVVLILILTRVENFGIKEHLIKQEPSFSIYFGSYGTFRVSASLVFSLQNILTYPNLNWKYELLYVPFLIPFVLVSVVVMLVYRKDMECRPFDIAKTVGGRLKNPAIALMGALVLVQLLIRSGTAAPAYILGTILSDWCQEAFVIICPLLGCLGSFFSGSTTVSNLSFGEIQRVAAESIGVSTTTMLALQTVGASAGNGGT
jgi:lactate permease